MVSVIVPVYNPGKWFDSCVESLLGQTYKDIEILLVDDGSTDGSSEKCDAFAERDPRIRVFHIPNQGVSHARNLGLSEAMGNYISFIDSDDWIEPDTLEKSVRRLEENDGDMAVFAMQIDRQYADRVEETKLSLGVDQTVTPKQVAERFGELFYADYLSSSCTKLFKRELIEKHSLGFDQSLVMYEDLHFVLGYMAVCQRLCLMQDICYHYRMDATVVAVSKRKTKNLLKNLETVVTGIRSYFDGLGICPDDPANKVIVDLYMIYVYKLFVEKNEKKVCIAGIKELMGIQSFRKALGACSSYGNQGRFYKIIALCMKNRWAWPVYLLYRRKFG